MRRWIRALGIALTVLALGGGARAAGTLTPLGSTDAPLKIRDHSVSVVINNGFARTEVSQTFFNPNDRDLEAIYSFPLPKSASLSEMTIYAGELEIHGEVVTKEQAEEIYGKERDAGNDAGLASKNSYQTFDFHVSPVRAQDETRMRFVYYQPLEIDTGVGRYVYALEDGGTDEIAKSFWVPNVQVEGHFAIDLELKSAWPIADVRVPGFENQAVVTRVGDGHHTARLDLPHATLERDFVFYYRLEDGLPGRVEVVPFRDDTSEPGTFMMVVTPGVDLQPLTNGVDWVFVLDLSGSMQGKLHTLTKGIERSLGELTAQDRFRVVIFNSRARELTRDWVPATPENVGHWIGEVAALQSGGSTNLYDGLALGLSDLDDDRATNLILVTDAVTNTGVVDPKKFHQLMGRYDIRVFGFLMGNNANWPLMRSITRASGGFSSGVSNADDLLGQILLAKSKVTHEALHDVDVKIRGVDTWDVTGDLISKVYRGQQLVLFGRYEEGGVATVEITARKTGEDKTYRTQFEFPDRDLDHPELERLFGLARIEELEDLANAGLSDVSEAEHAIQDLGLEYQLVTDYTSMVAVSDEAFARYGIERRNQARVAREKDAQARRAQGPIRHHRVDRQQPAFPDLAPDLSGSGAIDPMTGLIALGLVGAAAAAARRRRSS